MLPFSSNVRAGTSFRIVDSGLAKWPWPLSWPERACGEPLETTFGVEGDPWHWQDGGVVEVGAKVEPAKAKLVNKA